MSEQDWLEKIARFGISSPMIPSHGKIPVVLHWEQLDHTYTSLLLQVFNVYAVITHAGSKKLLATADVFTYAICAGRGPCPVGDQ